MHKKKQNYIYNECVIILYFKETWDLKNNEEKYISFSKSILVNTYTNKKGEIVNVMEEIRFLDTLAFMPSSLEKLAEILAS